jgi:ABC-type uncharacterized transport system permease subunit
VSAPVTSTPRRGPRFPFRLRLEQRMDTPGWLPVATSIGAVVVALCIGGVILWAAGGNPIKSYQHIFRAAFGSLGVLNDTLVKASPLILVGLACSLAFRMRLWNIGAEGQLYLGAFGASAVVLIPILSADTPRWLMLSAMAVAGFAAGALWGFVPGYFKARFNVNEIITTLMMNYIAASWNNYWIFAHWNESGFQMSPTFPKSAWLPRLSDYAEQIPAFSGFTLHLGIALSLAMVFVVWLIVYRSRWGYEIRLIGDNPNAARYAGLNIVRNTVLVMMLSGGLAGLAGMAEIAGVVHRFQERISPGYGFTGIIIAWLAKLNPFAVVLVSILFGGLILAGREIQPSGIPLMLQGIILFCIISSEVLVRYRILIRRQEA